MTRIGMARVHGAASGAANAGWFGDGRDGDLTVEAGQTLALEVAQDEGQIFKQYKNLTIEAGAVLKPANRCNGMVLLVSGDLTVDGTISVDKCAPLVNTMEEQALNERHIKLCGALTGGNGGAGGAGKANGTQTQVGAGGSGGIGFSLGGGFGGGGGAGNGTSSSYNPHAYAGASGEPRPPIGTTIPYANTMNNYNPNYGVGGNTNYRKGAAGPGGGGAADPYATGETGVPTVGDAIGGGALWVFVKGKVRIGSVAQISANGGDGGKGASGPKANSTSSMWGNGGGGGGGGGGILAIVHTGDYVNQGSITVNGGTGGLGGQGGMSSSGAPSGENGVIGTILITTLNDLLQVDKNPN